jgi:hypothetical protein
MKTLYYILMSASEEGETQKKGIVGIIVNVGKNRAVSFLPSSRKTPALLSSLPCRLSALHFCVDDATAATQWISMVMVVLGSRVRARFRIHRGKLFVRMLAPVAEHTLNYLWLLLTFYYPTVHVRDLARDPLHPHDLWPSSRCFPNHARRG